MRVLVTGATTPLGHAIIRRLLAASDVAFVLAVCRGVSDAPDDARLAHYTVDLGHARAVHDLLHGPARQHAIDAVIHTAPDDGPRGVAAARALVHGCAHHPTIRRFVYRSFGDVYARPAGTVSLLEEDAPIELDGPARVRDRVAADLAVCMQHGDGLAVTVLRCAELFAPDCGSQLWDYVSSYVCLRAAGFDPMLNLLALPDAVAACDAALRATADGVFNIPGAETLPLSCAVAACGRIGLAVPSALLAPLYALRRALTAREFRYELNAQRFHGTGILDGARARARLGYVPHAAVVWPRAHSLARTPR